MNRESDLMIVVIQHLSINYGAIYHMDRLLGSVADRFPRRSACQEYDLMR